MSLQSLLHSFIQSVIQQMGTDNLLHAKHHRPGARETRYTNPQGTKRVESKTHTKQNKVKQKARNDSFSH